MSTSDNRDQRVSVKTDKAKEWLTEWHKSPDNQAILLVGQWGSGKTTFVKQLVSSATDPRMFHLSLFSLQSSSDLEAQMRLLTYSFVKKAAFALVTGAKHYTNRKFGINIGDFLNDISNNGMDLNELANEMDSVFKDCIFFLDDLDRLSQDFIDEILKTVADLSENHGAHIVVIGDPENFNSINYALMEKTFSKILRIDFRWSEILLKIIHMDFRDSEISDYIFNGIMKTEEKNLRKIKRCVNALK